MKKYLKPEMVLQIIKHTDVLTTSAGLFYGQEFDNGNDDIWW